MPDIGEGLSEGELLAWRIAVGDRINEGDEVAEISTDKVAVALPAPRSGVVVELLWQPGAIVPVGAVLMRIETTDAAAAVGDRGRAGPAPAAAPSAAPVARPAAAGRAVASAVRASPMLRRYAQEKGVDLNLLAASANGRELRREDIDRFVERRADGNGAADDAPANRERLSGPRLAAALRLAKSSRTLATSTVSCEIDGRRILTVVERSGEPRLSPLAVVAQAACVALMQQPRFNASIVEESNELVRSNAVHLGIAVDTPAGLLVPVICDAQSLTARALGDAIGKLALAARDGRLTHGQLSGSSFTISSTGGLESVTMTSTAPIVNLPNVATLWISRIVQRPRVIEGSVVAAPTLACSLSFDHRFIHGAEAIVFLNALDAALDAILEG